MLLSLIKVIFYPSAPFFKSEMRPSLKKRSVIAWKALSVLLDTDTNDVHCILGPDEVLVFSANWGLTPLTRPLGGISPDLSPRNCWASTPHSLMSCVCVLSLELTLHWVSHLSISVTDLTLVYSASRISPYSWDWLWQAWRVEDVAARLQDQVGHDAAQAADQQPQGARQRGGGRAGEEGAQLPHWRPDEEETCWGKSGLWCNIFNLKRELVTYFLAEWLESLHSCFEVIFLDQGSFF